MSDIFVNFIEQIIVEQFLIYGEILILNNTAVYVHGAVDVWEDYLRMIIFTVVHLVYLSFSYPPSSKIKSN